MVVYFSDHGEMLGQHGRWHKESFFEDSARVPLIVRHPEGGLVPVVAEPCSLVDLMPTLCDFGGVPPPPGLDGASLMPALTGAAAEPSRPVKVETYTYWEGKPWSSDSNRMVRRGKWKLSYYGHSRTFELFNLEQDPGEVRNLAAAPECAAVVAELSPLLFDDGWSADTGAMLRAKLDAMGWAANVRGFHDAVARDPLPIDATDLWPAMPAVRTWLEDPRLDKLPAYLLIVGEKQSLSGANT